VPDRVVYTKEAAIAGANVLALSICNPAATPTPTVGALRLFDGTITIDEDTTRAALIVAETTLIGYPAGGYDLEAFGPPLFSPLGGVIVTANIVTVAYASGAAVVIGGYWIDDPTAVTPRCREIVVYDPPRPLAEVGQGWPIAAQLGYGRN
jgi:hypothetical protein